MGCIHWCGCGGVDVLFTLSYNIFSYHSQQLPLISQSRVHCCSPGGPECLLQSCFADAHMRNNIFRGGLYHPQTIHRSQRCLARISVYRISQQQGSDAELQVESIIMMFMPPPARSSCFVSNNYCTALILCSLPAKGQQRTFVFSFN